LGFSPSPIIMYIISTPAKKTASQWLSKNLTDARRQQIENSARRERVSARIKDIETILRLKELLWCSYWGLNLQNGVLKSLHSFVTENSADLGHMEGVKIIVSDLYHTTLAADRGAKHTICLAALDQQEDWSKFLKRYNERRRFLVFKKCFTR